MSGPGRNRMGPREIAWTLVYLLAALAAYWYHTGAPPWPTTG